MDNHSRETWIDAAFAQFNRGGLASVKVEALSRDLYATKGSFYWHFENRSDLIAAVIERWEQRETDSIIELAEQEGTPYERLVRLYTLVGERMYERGGERTLFSEAEGEGVLDVVARVLERRVDYVTGILEQLGLEQPKVRAATVVAAALGLQQMVTGGWEPLSGSEHTEMLLRMTLVAAD